MRSERASDSKEVKPEQHRHRRHELGPVTDEIGGQLVGRVCDDGPDAFWSSQFHHEVDAIADEVARRDTIARCARLDGEPLAAARSPDVLGQIGRAHV